MGAHARPVDRESAHCISRARLTLERFSCTIAFEMAEFQPVRIDEPKLRKLAIGSHNTGALE
jgi:hypothetical protein